MTTMNKMKCMALLAAFSASVCMAQTKADSSQAPAPQVLNAVVAVVNNDVITTGELAERAHSAALNLRRQKIQLPPMPQLRAQVLEQLILERAIAQRARETGIRVDDGVVNATIEQIALMCKMTGTDLHHVGDAGVGGLNPENLMAYSIAIRGKRHTYLRMARSINR